MKTSRFIHFFTNSFILRNRRSLRGKNNTITDAYAPWCSKTRFIVRGACNKIELHTAMMQNVHIYILGNENKVFIGPNSKLRNTTLWIKADGCSIILADTNALNNCEIGVEGNGGSVILKSNVQIGGYTWLYDRPNSTETARVYASSEAIEVDEYTVISDGTTVRTTDSHNITDIPTGTIVNLPADIRLGKHCWVCSGAMLLKGTKIGNDCIVGARAMVNRDYSAYSNVILAGSPAKIVREHIMWEL